MTWTHPAIRRLREAVGRGETDAEIAAAIGCTAESVRSARSRNGIGRVRTYGAKMTREDLTAAVERGETDKEIAAANSMTKGGVTQARRRWGIPAAVRPPRIDDAIVVAMIKDGAEDTDIARHLSCSDQTIRTHRAKLAIVRDGVTLPRGRAAPIPPYKRDLIRAAAAHGWTRNQMLRQFKIGPKRLKRILEQA